MAGSAPAALTGEFGGLGIEIDMEDGFIKVIAPIADTPAQRAGVEAGDVIVRLDGRSIKGITLNEAVKRMRGEPGTEITLTILREKVTPGPFEITITRAVIEVASVNRRVLEEGYGYLRISHFQPRTGEDLRNAVSATTYQLQKRSWGGSLRFPHVKSIRRATRKQYSAEEKIRIVLEGLLVFGHVTFPASATQLQSRWAPSPSRTRWHTCRSVDIHRASRCSR